MARLEAEHTREAIAARLAAGSGHSYLRDCVLGAIDGCVTTFAVVSGVAGAGLPTGVVLVLGAANLLADGFSMTASSFDRAPNILMTSESLRVHRPVRDGDAPQPRRSTARSCRLPASRVDAS